MAEILMLTCGSVNSSTRLGTHSPFGLTMPLLILIPTLLAMNATPDCAPATRQESRQRVLQRMQTENVSSSEDDGGPPLTRDEWRELCFLLLKEERQYVTEQEVFSEFEASERRKTTSTDR